MALPPSALMGKVPQYTQSNIITLRVVKYQENKCIRLLVSLILEIFCTNRQLASGSTRPSTMSSLSTRPTVPVNAPRYQTFCRPTFCRPTFCRPHSADQHFADGIARIPIFPLFLCSPHLPFVHSPAIVTRDRKMSINQTQTSQLIHPTFHATVET
jgi:hypothetical protein